MGYTVETNIFRANVANRNHLQLQWFWVSNPLLRDFYISNMQLLETKQKALKCLWPSCKDWQVLAVVWSFCPLNKWPQLMQ